MISYEIYKLLHICFIFLFLTSTALVFTSHESLKKPVVKIFFAIISFLIFVAGMGLIARLGFKHEEPFPLWIRLKMLNWVIAVTSTIFMYRTPSPKLKIFFIL